MLPSDGVSYIFYLLLFVYIIDSIISFTTILSIRNMAAIVNKENREDNTEEITKNNDKKR